MVTTMQAVAGALFLAALAYFLYLWNRRKNMIRCPECGAHIDLYSDECEHCGHTKQDASIEASVTETETAAVTDDAVGDGPEPEDDAQPVDSGDVDYDALVADNTIKDIKARIEEDDLDLQRVLDAEKQNKDRVTLKDWLEERMSA